MIDSISLWHVTPTDIGVEFLDPTDTALATDEWFYHIANHPEVPIARQDFSKSDRKPARIHCVRSGGLAPPPGSPVTLWVS